MAIKNTYGKVVVSVDLEYKNWHTFSNGLKIRRERQYNELDRKLTQPVNAIVVSADNINTGTEILIHPNSTHETNRINNTGVLSGKDEGSDIKIYSIPLSNCYAYFENNEWLPLENFEFGLRVFSPYSGIMEGILPEKIKDVLFITTGDLKGIVVRTLKACDYEIIFQDRCGTESRLIRLRHSVDPEFDREEVIAIDNSLTEKVHSGELLIGISETDCKYFQA